MPSILVISDTHCVVYDGLDPQTGAPRFFEPASGRAVVEPVEQASSVWTGEAMVFADPPASLLGFASVAFLCAFAVSGLAGVFLRYRCAGRR